MKQIVLKIAFDGTDYHGFQLQPRAISVQQRIEEVASRIFSKKRVVVGGCSRTDAGVHAREFYCSFAAETNMTAEKIKGAMLALLPEDISVKDCYFTDIGFSPRYAASAKRYSYTIINTPVRDPFRGRYAQPVFGVLDAALMDRAAKLFEGEHDFSAFMSAGSKIRDTVRTVSFCGVRREGDFVIIEIEANGFLYNMVRIIAGTLVEVAQGKIPLCELSDIIASGDRLRAGVTMAGKGLCLDKVTLREHKIIRD